jgi:hypothetical protein
MYLKVAQFNFALLTLGCLEDGDAARLLGMKTPKTIERARAGGAVSSELMGCAMAAFKLNAERLRAIGIEVSLDTFFEEGTREEREQPAELAEVAV